MFKYMNQIFAAVVVFVTATMVTWYGGSAILENSFEWGYSTPFSQWLNGSVVSASDISVFDHFVYAAKFKPFFPALMMVSFVYFIILIGFILLRKRRKALIGYNGLLGLLLLISSLFIMNFATIGGRVFFYLLLTLSICCFVLSIFIYRKRRLII